MADLFGNVFDYDTEESVFDQVWEMQVVSDEGLCYTVEVLPQHQYGTDLVAQHDYAVEAVPQHEYAVEVGC